MTAFAGGVILLYSLDEIPPWPVFVIAAIMGIGLWRIGHRCRRIAPWVLGLVLGLAWAGWHAGARIDSRLPASMEDSVWQVQGYRCSLVSPGAYDSLRFDFCVTGWGPQPPSVTTAPKRLRLALYDEDPPPDLPMRMQLSVRLKRPHGAVNPAGFRYETWLFRHGYDATGSVREWGEADVPCWLTCRYHTLREDLAGALRDRLGGMDEYRLLEALLLGERGRLTPADWDLFKATGTSHLIAISGLHIGLVGMLVGGLFGLVQRRLSGRGSDARRQRWVRAAGVLLGCLAYALAAGFTVPTQRALVMAVVASVLYVRARLSGAWTAWLCALCFVLLIDPLAPLDGGFWLSFGAVASLILVFVGRVAPAGRLQGLLQAQFVVVAGLLPVMALAGLPMAPLGWLANLVAIPLVSVLVLPVALAGALIALAVAPLAGWAGLVIDACLQALMQWLSWVAAIAPEPVAVPLPLAVLLASLAVVALLPLRWPARAGLFCVAVVAIAGCVVPGRTSTPAANARITEPELWVWDVGQGLAVTYREGARVLQYDSGPGSASGYTAVDSVLLPVYRALGIGRLDWLVISHGDADHASGLDDLLDKVSSDRFISGEPGRVTDRIERHHRAIGPCYGSGQLGQARLSFWRDAQAEPGNASSCVLVIQRDGWRIVLPGDLTAEEERRWLAQHRDEARSRTILVAPHHGSATSSSEAWIRALAPDVVVFAAGYHHPYGHPAPEVVQRYRAAGARLFNTATAGAVRIRLSESGVQVTPWRSDVPFWVEPFTDAIR